MIELWEGWIVSGKVMGYKGGEFIMYHSSVVFERYDTRDTDGGGLPIELQRGIIDERERAQARKKRSNRDILWS